MRKPKSNNIESKKICNRGHWRPAEDDKLTQLVKQHGPQNWNFISEHFEGRSGKSCRLRWYNQLDPNIIKKPFSNEDEERLLALHRVKGNKWAEIARFFPGRTDNAVKNHFHVLTARRKRDRLTLFRGHDYNNNNLNSRTNFVHLQNCKNNKGTLFGMPSTNWSSGSSSTITTNFNASCSNVLGSYHSFTAPGLPTIGKVVPLQHNFTSMINNSTSLDHHQQQEADLNLKKKDVCVSFIDFLGVGSRAN